MSRRLRVVIAQLNLRVGDVAGNVECVIEAAQRARDEFHADLILFPELTLTGYPPEDLLLRPGFLAQVEEGLNAVKTVSGIGMVVGLPERGAEGLYNSAVYVRDGDVRAIYRKQQLPNYSVFDEKRYFIAGESPCVFECCGVRIGITICEDMWHPGTMTQAATAGAQLLLNLNASPYHRNKGREREDVMRQRLHEAQLPVVYCNLVGGQDELVFDGESFVIDASGGIVLRGRPFVEDLYPIDFELTAAGVAPVPAIIRAPLPDIESIYHALVLGVRDYVQKNGFKGAVIGLSGGIDSALTLAIAVDALGADRVEAVRMPSRYTADMSLEDAEAQCRAQGVLCRTIPIEAAFITFLDLLREEFAGQPWDTTEENIQARCRGILLMAISNKTGRMVLTTGNKSEMAVGYCTLYGDMAGGYAPIKDVPKTLVYHLAEYRNSIAPVIPQRVLQRPPSAELAPDQKDEDSLPPYAVLDPILEMYVERDMDVADIVAAGFERATVERVVTLVNRNEYKRRQAPPGVRISRRAFGRDRRYPITSGYR